LVYNFEFIIIVNEMEEIGVRTRQNSK